MLNWLIAFVIFVVVTLLLVDAVFVEIPWVRRCRRLLGGLVVFLGGVVVGRGVSGELQGSKEEIEPETFDDEPERKTDAEAADLDIETAAADRDLDALDESNAELRRRLEALQDEPGGSQ